MQVLRVPVVHGLLQGAVPSSGGLLIMTPEEKAGWAFYDFVMPDHIRDHLTAALNPLGRGLPDGY